MDDYLVLFEDVTLATTISCDMVLLFRLRVFNLTNFVSNASENNLAMSPEVCETHFTSLKRKV